MRLDDVGRHRNALGARQLLDLAAAVEKSLADRRIGPERTDRQPRRAGEAGERHEKDELLPNRHAAVLDRFDLNVGAPQAPRWMACTRAVRRGSVPKTSPKTMRRCVPVCSMTPGAASAVAM